MTRRFLGEELASILEGSYEGLRSRVEAALLESRKRLFGGEYPLTLEGTFNGYAIVVVDTPTEDLAEGEKSRFSGKMQNCVADVSKKGGSANPFAVCHASIGKEAEAPNGAKRTAKYSKLYPATAHESRELAYRVKYEVAQNKKDIIVMGAEVISAPVYTESQFVSKEALAYVDAFMRGTPDRGAKNLANVVQLVQEQDAPPPPAKLLEATEVLVRGERPWKKAYAERLGQIHTEIKDQLPKIEESRLFPKFKKLYDGTNFEGDLSGFESLVASDLKYLAGRFDTLVEQTESSVSTLKGAIPALKTKTDPTVEAFESFADDFLSDLRGVQKSFVEATNSTNRLDEAAKLYDAVVVELHRYDVAGSFVATAVNRLSETKSEEK